MEKLEQAVRSAQERIEVARAHHAPLRIRGGGSKAFYAPPSHGDVLDARVFSGVISYEPSELVITAGAGTPLVELEALLAQHGQCLPFEPPHYTWTHVGQSQATLGGMVATGLAGPARANVGGVRDYVLGLKLINGLAQHLTFGGQVMKNVAGYDVSRLMVGSLGTLGVITEVSLKVLPLAPSEATLVFELAQGTALERLHHWGAQPLPLNASCWVRDTSDSAGPRNLLFVRLRGAKAAVSAACNRMLADVAGQRMDHVQSHALWERCRNQQLPFFKPDPMAHDVLWRINVPQTAMALDLPYAQLIEWHGGLRWLWAPEHARDVINATVKSAGGNAAIFVAPNRIQVAAPQRLATSGAAETAIGRRLKTSFDPLGIFNPGLSPHADQPRA
jgi:glycolate oxidase FAD binding subunit